MIPAENTDDLMLKDEVLDAVREGKFSIYAVKTIEEGIYLLTDTEAGEENEDGAYPEGTVFARVAKRLLESYENRKNKEEDDNGNGMNKGKEEDENI
jgi:predicted ATP-dependent protease